MIEIIFSLILILGGVWSLINYFFMERPTKPGRYLGNIFGSKKIKITKQNKFYFDFMDKIPVSNSLFVIVNIFAILIGVVGIWKYTSSTSLNFNLPFLTYCHEGRSINQRHCHFNNYPDHKH